MICRHSSEPIEPPAPVTSTHLPRMQEPNSFGCGGTGSRPAGRSTSTSHSSLICALPEIRSERFGRDCTCTPSGSSCVRISRRRRRVADGMASRMRSMRCSRTSFGSDSEPYTRMPLMLLPCSDFLSSMKATGSKSGPPSSTEHSARAGVAGAVDRHACGGLGVRARDAGTDSALRSGCRPRRAAPAPSRCRTPTAGSAGCANKRSKAASTSTDRLTPAITVSIALGPTKRITARYRPNTEKNSSTELMATRK